MVLPPRKRDEGHERGADVIRMSQNSFKIVTLNTSLQSIAVRVWVN